jgi:hypothetical protein
LAAAGTDARLRLEDALVALAQRDGRSPAGRPHRHPVLSLHDIRNSIADMARVLALEPRQFDALDLLGLDFLALASFKAVLAVHSFHEAAKAQILRLTSSAPGTTGRSDASVRKAIPP